MADAPVRAIDVMNQRYLLDHPLDAARHLEKTASSELVDALTRQSAKILSPVFQQVMPDTAARLLAAFPDDLTTDLLKELPPPKAVRILGHMKGEASTRLLGLLPENVREEFSEHMSYPQESAGRLMNTAIPAFRRDMTAGEALDRLRVKGMKTARSLFLVDDEHHLTGRASLQVVALADPSTSLGQLEEPIVAKVMPVDGREEVTKGFEGGKVLDIPVVNFDGVFLGAVTHEDLAHTIQEQATVDLQTMVGAGKEERALSSPLYTVRMRMPWLQINLVTAFLAAAVVGMFENTIAQVTALAVLLPVVAGQSGNTGAQALAVTMRGLALREVTVRQWSRVMRKEVVAGLMNGVSVAITCGIGVYIWSQSLGLVVVIASSMVMAMVAAGFAGALIPMALTRLGQDPATSSSIILTTVTDIAGFFSFLGIATLLMAYL